MPNRSAGVAANNNNAQITVSDVDATGQCAGSGVVIGGHNLALGAGYTLDGITAAARSSGVVIGNGEGFSVTNSVIGGNTTGISSSGLSLIPNTLVVSDVTNTASRFRVAATTNMVAGQTLRVSLPGGPEDRVITLVAAPFVTVSPALSTTPLANGVVQGAGFGATRLVVSNSDVCANATGLSATSATTATNNYWRAASGPRHASIAGGTGDLVSASVVTLAPFVTVPNDKDNVYCNQAPVPAAGLDRTVCEHDLVVLDASASFDPDVEPIAFDWAQVFGPTVTLLPDPDPAIARFYASVAQTLTFELLTFGLTVSDDVVSRSDTVDITVQIRNKPPSADAGVAQVVNEGDLVQLVGAGTDPEAETLAYQWVQTGGPAAMLTGANSATPTFIAPTVGPGGGPGGATLTFELTVTDVQPPSYCGGRSARSRSDRRRSRRVRW